MFKRILALSLSVVMILAMLTSCDLIKGDKGDQNVEHQHTFSEEWSFDAVEHWHAATCEHSAEKGDLAKHNDKDYDGICNACGYNLYGETDNEEEKKVLTYVVDVTDASGAPVGDVKIILISADGFYTSTKSTNSHGRVSFTLEEGTYVAALAEAVDGYSTTVDERFELSNSKVTIVLK
jgi:hypothetical protein